MKVYFGFGISDSMFQESCRLERTVVSPDYVRALLLAGGVEMCLNPWHEATIQAARVKFDLAITVPPKAPIVQMERGDKLIVMSPRGLPRLEGRHEYTDEEIEKASFAFSIWEVLCD